MLTVVVPSLNRQDYLLRQIRFWARSSARLVIVDGSNEPLDVRVQAAVVAHPRIAYLHEQSSLAVRLNLAAGLIETPYAVMLGDDEFHLPTGLSASLSVLEDNPDLVGCMGQVLSFSPVGPYRRLVFARAYRSLHGYGVRHAAPLDRLIAAMSEYTVATCYAVLRTMVWRRSWGALGAWRSGAAIELQQAMTVCLLGGVATTDHVQWLRSIENPPDLVSPEGKSWRIQFPEWWESPLFESERSRYVGTLATVAAGDTNARHGDWSAWVVAGAETYVESNRGLSELEPPLQRLAVRLLQPVSRVLRGIARNFPDWLFLGAKRWRGRAMRSLGRSGGDYYGTVEDLPRIFRAEGLVLTPGVVDEIASVEVMVRAFHALRLDET